MPRKRKKISKRKPRGRTSIDVYDKEVIRTLYRSRIELNTNEIATSLGVEWITAKRHLDRLKRLGYVTYRLEEGRRMWRLQ